MIGVMMACLEALAYASILAGGVAGTLTLAAALSLMGSPAILMEGPALTSAGLAFAGALVVYNVDRLRDLERDRHSSPRRSAFVSHHRRALVAIVVLAGSAAAALGWRAGPAAVGLCGAVLLPSLFHRRIKHHPGVKLAYVTAAWVAVVVGLPALNQLEAVSPRSALGWPGDADLWHRVVLVASVYGAAIGSNLIASNVREGEISLSTRRARHAIWTARGVASLGVVIALAGSPPLRPLACIPLAQLAGLTGFRGDERGRFVWVDGSLLLGALATLGLQTLL
jgi:hypothetical protein